MRRFHGFLLAVYGVATVITLDACSPPQTTNDAADVHVDAVRDIAGDAGTVCAMDRECDDAVFCNGVERCAPGAPGANVRGCVAALPASPCATDEICSEATERCT